MVKAVERNKGLVLVCPETYVGDWLHRLSRTLNDTCMKMLAKLMLKWI